MGVHPHTGMPLQVMEVNFGVVELSPSPSDDVMSWVRLKLKPPVENISYSI